jgi:hypothetical protein
MYASSTQLNQQLMAAGVFAANMTQKHNSSILESVNQLIPVETLLC